MTTPSAAQADPARGHTSATLLEASGLPIDLDPDLRPLWPGARLAGPAFTVQGTGGDNLALHRAILLAPAKSVLVVDVGGARHGHWGEILAVAAQTRGIAGLLLDGGARDAAEQQRLGFPVFSRNNAIRGTGKDFPGMFGVRVTVGGIAIDSGDLVVGDVDGVVAVPAAHIDRVLAAADARVAKETEYLARIRAGETTMALYGFRPPGSPA